MSGQPSYFVIAGAGSAGTTWRDVAGPLGATVVPMPVAPDAAGMADALVDQFAALLAPRVLIGASAGGMVALELARRVHVEALILVAAGFGIDVSERAFAWLMENPPDLHQKLARICLFDRTNQERLDLLVADYDACGQPAHVQHLEAIRRYRPEQLPDPPPTTVLWGVHDRAVPLADHVELALRCRGMLVPIPDSAHVPFLEQPEITLAWIRWAAELRDA
jgi:pimeloyl-ACP methyl ester carboxylesterase